MQNKNKKVCKLFIETRKIMGLNQKQMAALLGIHQPNISKIEKGERGCPGWMILEIIDLKNQAIANKGNY